jgi:hypothetical protein
MIKEAANANLWNKKKHERQKPNTPRTIALEIRDAEVAKT